MRSSHCGVQEKGSITKHVKKRESMFKSPDTIDGRVGVVNSDKIMTDYQPMKKVRIDKPKPLSAQ